MQDYQRGKTVDGRRVKPYKKNCNGYTRCQVYNNMTTIICVGGSIKVKYSFNHMPIKVVVDNIHWVETLVSNIPTYL